jgi:sterol desaturase/sphingolipid hydroxylase (fatty acid hydroxylase superfamily)
VARFAPARERIRHMTAGAFFLAVASVQGAFVVLDLVDRHLTRDQRYGGERARPATVGFFVGIVLLFLLVEAAGMALVPRIDVLMEWTRARIGVPEQFARAPHGWMLIVLSIALFYVAGFFDYAWHRWFSHHPLFWFTHEYHHLPSQVFVGMPGLATRPFVVITIVPVVLATATTVYVALRLAGQPMWDWTVFQIPLLAATTVLTTSHSSFLRRSWRLHSAMRWFALTTPQEHLLHHTVDLAGNYGNFTSLWDRLFGTYLDPRRVENQGHRVGLGYEQDFLGSLTVGTLHVPARWRRRLQLNRYVNLDE